MRLLKPYFQLSYFPIRVKLSIYYMHVTVALLRRAMSVTQKMDTSNLCYQRFSTGLLTLTLPGPSAGVSGSLDSYCSLKPLCSGMGEVVPARTSPTLLPHPLALCCHCPVSKCRSASIAVTGTLRINIFPILLASKICRCDNDIHNRWNASAVKTTHLVYIL